MSHTIPNSLYQYDTIPNSLYKYDTILIHSTSTILNPLYK